MSKQAKHLILVGLFTTFMIGLLFFTVGQTRTARQIHQVTMLRLSITENRDEMKHLTDIIDDGKRYGDQFSSQTFAISEQRGMIRAYTHRDCKHIVLYDKIIKDLELKPEMETVEYCKKNFDVGLGRFE